MHKNKSHFMYVSKEISFLFYVHILSSFIFNLDCAIGGGEAKENEPLSGSTRDIIGPNGSSK